MHTNPRFNIMQHTEINSRLFVVIEGKRAPGGYAETGAKIITRPMSRDEAIALADKMERDIPA